MTSSEVPVRPAPGLGAVSTAEVRVSGAEARAGGGLTVAEMLELPVLQRGRPEVLAGADITDRLVRWVHTSEIYDIAPLLRGGEVLLTTGLGLVGASPTALYEYAVGLAERSVSALILELGRTFTGAPAALVAGATDAGLPLVTLRGIVPFVEITEAVHALLISDEIALLRLGRQVDTAMTAAVLSGGGLPAILREAAAVAGCPALLYADDGHLVAGSEETDLGPSVTEAEVELHSRRWGRLVLADAPTAARGLVAERTASAVALELGRTGGGTGRSSRRRAGALLLKDLFGRQYSSIDEAAGRAAALGVSIRPGGFAWGICLAVDPPGPATDATVAEVVEATLGSALVTELDGSFLIATSATIADPRAAMETLADAIDAALETGRCAAVTCGPAVTEIAALARSLRVAREASMLARRLGSDMRTLLASDMGVQRLLSRFATDPELAAFVEEQLGPLLDYDASHGRELVHTLDVLLACGLSKAEAARRLHIRRQTLYQRLETINTLLGGLDLGARERRTSLDLALVGWRLRNAGASGGTSSSPSPPRR